MSTLNCIAIDDEPFALAILEDDLKKISGIQIVQTFNSTRLVEKFLAEHKVDLIFLDINMPSQLGTHFLKSLSDPPMIIFTTAHEKYAVEGFELNALDYLLKPISFSRLEQACAKAIYKAQLTQTSEFENDIFIIINSEYNKIKIFEKEILYIEGLKDYVKIYVTTQEKAILTRMNLKKMESKLSQSRFCRVHQSYIISIDKIDSVQKTKLILNNLEIPIGQKYTENFHRRYSI